MLLLLGSGIPVQAQVTPSDPNEALLELGRTIYLQGKLSHGETITAKVLGDVALQGPQYACVNCHRRSGIGTSEGGDQVLPVNAQALFSPRTAALHDSYPSGGMHTEARPGYTTESLGRALRQGIDPSGRELSALMPRFVLTDKEVHALSTYLSSLNATTPPGIDDQEIHFATITTPGNEASRDAMLNVLNTFFHDKNAGTRGESKRAQNAPYQKAWAYESYRRWRLHEWALHGPTETWPAQLLTLYEKQPVFAVLGGLGRGGDWQPIHHFCEKQQLPCLMPQLSLPPSYANNDFYSLYFSRGVDLEAQTLARYLGDTFNRPQKVIQVRDHNPASIAAAQQLQQALEGRNNLAVTEIVVKESGMPDKDFWARLARKYADAVWVLWLEQESLQGINSLAGTHLPSTIYLSASLQQDITGLLQHPLHSHFTLITPYRAADNEKITLRFRTWARLRKLPIRDLNLQSSTFLAANLVGETLMHMNGNFSREYFLERIEHIIDNMINPSLYTHISLAPGQRYAVKGCYVWEMSRKFDTAQWIVP